MKGMNNYDVENENKIKYVHEKDLSFTCRALTYKSFVYVQ